MNKHLATYGFEVTALILLILGGINWGFVLLFHLNLVTFLFGDFNILARILYGFFGLAAIYRIALWLKEKSA